MLLGWVAMIVVLGGYRGETLGAGTEEYKRVLNAGLIAGGLTAVACYLAQYPLSRGFFLLAYGLGVPMLLVGRYAARQALQSARRRGGLTRSVLIAGSRSHVDDVARVLSRETWLGYRVIGALTPEDDLQEETASGVPVLGSAGDAPAVALEHDADVIFFAGGSVGSASDMRHMFWTLEQTRSRSWSLRASLTSPASGSRSAPSAGCRSSTSIRPPGPTRRAGGSGCSTSSGRWA